MMIDLISYMNSSTLRLELICRVASLSQFSLGARLGRSDTIFSIDIIMDTWSSARTSLIEVDSRGEFTGLFLIEGYSGGRLG